MQKELVKQAEIKVVGITARTNNKNEMHTSTAKIGELAGRFWSENIASRIPNRKNPGVTLSIYTDYDSNEHGDYTYFIGEEVNSFDKVPTDFQTLTIPATHYQKFTAGPGKMPDVVIAAWQQIWSLSAHALGGERAYIADFEVYDQRASDATHASLDIYIGIK